MPWRLFTNNLKLEQIFGELLRIQRTRNGGKCVVRISSDQANGTDDQYQNHGQHHCILRDVLPFFVCPQVTAKLHHISSMAHGGRNERLCEQGEYTHDLIIERFYRPHGG